MSSDVRSYLVGSSECGSEGASSAAAVSSWYGLALGGLGVKEDVEWLESGDWVGGGGEVVREVERKGVVEPERAVTFGGVELSSNWGLGTRGGEMGRGGVVVDGGGEDVAMTRKVVRSNMITSVALHASASVVRCLVRTETLGMRVCTILDHA